MRGPWYYEVCSLTLILRDNILDLLWDWINSCIARITRATHQSLHRHPCSVGYSSKWETRVRIPLLWGGPRRSRPAVIRTCEPRTQLELYSKGNLRRAPSVILERSFRVSTWTVERPSEAFFSISQNIWNIKDNTKKSMKSETKRTEYINFRVV